MINTQQQPACTKKKQTILRTELPLSCPTDDMTLWNAHPKVYLPISKTGTATCPYCGTLFTLKDK